jgi:hypothetical protein
MTHFAGAQTIEMIGKSMGMKKENVNYTKMYILRTKYELLLY